MANLGQLRLGGGGFSKTVDPLAHEIGQAVDLAAERAWMLPASSVAYCNR